MKDDLIIEFSGNNSDCHICGWMALSEADDERPLNFYDAQGFEIMGGRYPTNPYDEHEDKKYFSFESLKEAMQTDELLIQFLVDFAEESTLINRDGYDLRINESNETAFKGSY